MLGPFPLYLIGIALYILVGAALLGSFLQKGFGALIVTGGAALVVGLCAAGFGLAGWRGLAIAVALVTLLIALGGTRSISKRRASVLLSLVWLAFCLICLLGYWAQGAVGLLTIALPANLAFWFAAFFLSGYMLPLAETDSRWKAFESLITFAVGRNYPYYVMNGSELEKRVDGNPFSGVLAGPGIVITGCDHLPVLTAGTDIMLPDAPGLCFTERFQLIQRTVDLRPQMRSFTVEARTSDAIKIQAETRIVFRIRCGGQKPAPGRSFPFDPSAVVEAVVGEVVEQGYDLKRDWEEQVPIIATRILRDIASGYEFDDLCLAMGPAEPGASNAVLRYADDDEPSPSNTRGDPRHRIHDALLAGLAREARAYGVDILDASIGDLEPADAQMISQRIDNWKTRWKNRITLLEAQRDASQVGLIEQAQMAVDRDLLANLAQILRNSLAQGHDLSRELLASTFVASLTQLAHTPEVKGKLSPDTERKLLYLRSLGKPVTVPEQPTSESGG